MSAHIENGQLFLTRVIGRERITNVISVDPECFPDFIAFTDLRERQRAQVDNAEWSAQDYIDNAG